MSITITMPALSPTMESGNLAKWLVKEGDDISAGDVIAEIETDKATMEVEAVDEGKVAKLLVAEGTEGVAVNAAIAILAEEGEDPSDVKAPANGADSGSDAPKRADATPDATPPATVPEKKPEPVSESAAAPPATDNNSSERIFASPLARRIAQQRNVDLGSIKGSGPRGRIVKADVEGAGSGGSQTIAATPSAPAPQTMSDEAIHALFEEGSFDAKPHDGMRKIIAQRLTESAQTIPSYFVTMECRIDALLALRAEINAAAPQDGDGKPTYKISVNDFIVKAMAQALMRVPMANVSWTSTQRLYHKQADVGVAVAVDDGLFTPIVRRANEKSLSAISAEIKDMASRARSRKLAPAEYQGGCTAVSNLGMFGVREFTSIINPPHASIVSIGAGEKKPMVSGDDIIVGTIMAATFAFDHRAIDGALGAELAAAFKQLIEQPAGMLA